MHNVSDILLGIFFFIPNNENGRKFRYDFESFTNFFYERRKKYSVLQKIPFDSDGVCPTSKVLDSALTGLLVSSLIEHWTHEPNHYRISKALDISWKNVRPRIKDSLGELEKLSAEFYSVFGN
jgi:hypothetical protein